MRTRDAVMYVGAALIPCAVYGLYNKEINSFIKKQRDKMMKVETGLSKNSN